MQTAPIAPVKVMVRPPYWRVRVASCEASSDQADGSPSRTARGLLMTARTHRRSCRSPWPSADLKDQIARLPEQPGVYLYVNRAGDTIYVGKARALRDRVRSYLGARGDQPEDRCAARRGRRARRHRHRLGGRGAGAREPPDQAAGAQVQHPAARRQELPVPAADARRRRFPRVLVVRRVERDGDVYAGPFLPACARPAQTMSLTHRLFGIRSCNEVITGQRGRPCLEYDIKRCLAPCVDDICYAQTGTSRPCDDARLLLEGRTDELIAGLRAAACGTPRRPGALRAGGAAARRRFAPSRRCATGSRRWRRRASATATRGASRLGPARRRGPGLPGARRARVVERVELVTEPDAGAATRRVEDVLEAALQQFYEEHGRRRPRSTCRLATARRGRARGLAVGAGRAPGRV